MQRRRMRRGKCRCWLATVRRMQIRSVVSGGVFLRLEACVETRYSVASTGATGIAGFRQVAGHPGRAPDARRDICRREGRPDSSFAGRDHVWDTVHGIYGFRVQGRLPGFVFIFPTVHQSRRCVRVVAEYRSVHGALQDARVLLGILFEQVGCSQGRDVVVCPGILIGALQMTSVGFDFVGGRPRGRGDVKVLLWPLGMLRRPLHLQA